jgi:hypothetical protein
MNFNYDDPDYRQLNQRAPCAGWWFGMSDHHQLVNLMPPPVSPVGGAPINRGGQYDFGPALAQYPPPLGPPPGYAGPEMPIYDVRGDQAVPYGSHYRTPQRRTPRRESKHFFVYTRPKY